MSDDNFSINDLDDLEGDLISVASDEDDEAHAILLESTAKATSVWQVASLVKSTALKQLLSMLNTTSTSSDVFGSIEHSPEYKRIIDANEYIASVQTDTLKAHSFIKDNYTRFPELESILPIAIDHARIILVVRNKTEIDQQLVKSILPATTALIVNVAFTTTKGPLQEEDALAAVVEACEMVVQLDTIKQQLLAYVQSRMTLIAPNLCAIIGPNVAAQLMSIAGGLTALSKIPACNIQVLGKKESVTNGLSRVQQNKHAGFIHYSDLVMSIQEAYRAKATRLISAKCALAIRIDVSRESLDGIHGMNMMIDIRKKIETMLEPPPGKAIKALPIPLEGPKKKRAGKRVSKQKEKFALTDIQKAQNRMAFGVEEEETGGSLGFTEGLGMIGGATGKIRTAAPVKRKIALSKAHKAMTDRLNVAVNDGFTTSLSSFTPVQGLALENPEARKEKLKQVNDKWFSSIKK